MKGKATLINKLLYKTINSLWSVAPQETKVSFINRGFIGRLDYPKANISMIITSLVSYIRLNSCKKEPQTVEWISSNLKESGVFYDIGANTGAYSLIASTLLKNQGKVIAFEPVPSTFIELCQNISLNKLGDKIIPINVPLYDENRIIEFGLNSFDGGVGMHMGLTKEELQSNRNETIFHYLVKTQTLDSLIAEYRIPSPTIMKIDVDGPEFQILKGASATLRNESLQSLQVEIDQVNQPVEEICQFLENHGLFLKEKHKHKNPNIFDYVFYRKNE